MNPSFPTLFALAALATALPAQLASGWQSTTTPVPTGAGNVLQLPGGERAWFTGTDLMLVHGSTSRSLLHFTSVIFGSFVIEAGNGMLLFGENSGGDVWLVPLQGPALPRVLANLPFNYDAVSWGPGRALVSAKLGGFSTPDNDVVALDLVTGAVTPLIRVPGASGPITLDGQGNVCYATSTLTFPAPPQSVQVLRWSALQVQAALGASVLGQPQAQVLYAGLDAAGDLACDGDGELYFVDWWNVQIGVLANAGTPRQRRSVLFDYGTAAGGVSVQFLAGPQGPAQPWFEPFQPPGGGTLLVHESDFAPTGINQLRAITSRRPVVSHRGDPIPRGNFDLVGNDAPAGGLALFAISAAVAPGETSLTLPGFEQPLFWNLGMLASASTWLRPVGNDGRTSLTLSNPGFTGGLQAFVQVACLDLASVIGSSAVHGFRLGQ